MVRLLSTKPQQVDDTLAVWEELKLKFLNISPDRNRSHPLSLWRRHPATIKYWKGIAPLSPIDRDLFHTLPNVPINKFEGHKLHVKNGETYFKLECPIVLQTTIHGKVGVVPAQPPQKCFHPLALRSSYWLPDFHPNWIKDIACYPLTQTDLTMMNSAAPPRQKGKLCPPRESKEKSRATAARSPWSWCHCFYFKFCANWASRWRHLGTSLTVLLDINPPLLSPRPDLVLNSDGV